MDLTMIPEPSALAPITAPTLRANGRPIGELRDALRTIPNTKNAISVGSVWVQTVGIILAALLLNHPLVWILAFMLMGRAHAQFAALMHESAHRLLFRNRRLNDWVGRWVVGFVGFTPIDLYRRGHMAHHRDEFGPDEPDIPMYRGYPITKSSFRRKLWRDATGRTGWKLFRGLLRGVQSQDATVRSQARSIVAYHLVLIVLSTALGYPWLWFAMWLAPHLTVWRVINRLRSIAEHGGMHQSADRRNTTHCVRQHRITRFWLVPNQIGWHLPHHVDSGVPMRNLPRFHRELIAAGYVNSQIEYPSYRALWRALSSRVE